MGTGFGITCASCGDENDFFVGIGMMYSSLENVIFLVSPHRRKKVLQMLQEVDREQVSFENKLFVCPKDHTLASRLDFSIEYSPGKVYRPYFRCPKCKSKLELLKEPISKIPCSNCGKRTLKETSFIMWD